jgi:hypothetical protein
MVGSAKDTSRSQNLVQQAGAQIMEQPVTCEAFDIIKHGSVLKDKNSPSNS